MAPRFTSFLALFLCAGLACAQHIDVSIHTDASIPSDGIHYCLSAPVVAFFYGPREGVLAPASQSPVINFDTLSLIIAAELHVEIHNNRTREEIFSATIVSNLNSPVIIRTLYRNPKYEIEAKDLDRIELARGHCTFNVRYVG